MVTQGFLMSWLPLTKFIQCFAKLIVQDKSIQLQYSNNSNHQYNMQPSILLLTSSNCSQYWPSNQSKRAISLSNKNYSTRPLNGISADIQHFKQFYGGPNYHPQYHQSYEIISTSRHSILRSKKQIIERIVNLFSNCPRGTCEFYFSGHGLPNGDFFIETKEYPYGQVLEFYELIYFWREHSKYQEVRFYLDSCYSGANIPKYLKMKELKDRIYIFTSCSPSCTSADTQFGGLLFLDRWTDYCQPKSLSKQIREQMHSQYIKKKPMRYQPSSGVDQNMTGRFLSY